VGGTGEFGVALPESVSGRMTATRDWRLQQRLVCQAQRVIHSDGATIRHRMDRGAAKSDLSVNSPARMIAPHGDRKRSGSTPGGCGCRSSRMTRHAARTQAFGLPAKPEGCINPL
jgi:hypothetical protein